MKTTKSQNMNYEIKEKLSNSFWKCTYLNGNVNYIMAMTNFKENGIAEKTKRLSEILINYETIENPIVKSELVFLDTKNNDQRFMPIMESVI